MNSSDSENTSCVAASKQTDLREQVQQLQKLPVGGVAGDLAATALEEAALAREACRSPPRLLPPRRRGDDARVRERLREDVSLARDDDDSLERTRLARPSRTEGVWEGRTRPASPGPQAGSSG